MKYKCKKCGKVFNPGLSGACPECGSFDVEVVYEHWHQSSAEVVPKQE
jgi:uncharacterized OB-fold protein